jgi:hypothetical protein
MPWKQRQSAAKRQLSFSQTTSFVSSGALRRQSECRARVFGNHSPQSETAEQSDPIASHFSDREHCFSCGQASYTEPLMANEALIVRIR